MAYRGNSKFLNRELKQGFTTYDDVYGIIKDNVDEISEFYELEPAMVLQVLLDPKEFPTIKDINNKNIPVYSYLGTIKARFLYSQSEGDEISDYIKPLSAHITAYPTKGEVVNVARHGGQYFYYHSLNIRNQVNMNRVAGERGEGLVLPQRTKHNRKILGQQGDLIINGRFGQGIKLGSDTLYKNPSIKITNRQWIDPRKIYNRSFPHVQDINGDGSSIYLTSGPLDSESDILIPAAVSNKYPPTLGGVMDGDMITINSDKIVINAKGSPGGAKNNGDIHMFAVRNINLTSNYEITLETGKNGHIQLGEVDAMNPAVKGFELEDLFEKLIDALSNFCNEISEPEIGVTEISDAAVKLKNLLIGEEDVGGIKDDTLPAIFSNRVFIANDGE